MERSVFQTEPEKYEDFVLSALKAPEIQRLYDKKALAAVLRQFLLHREYNGYEINRLKETFYSKEELEDERRVEAERKEQEKRLEQEKRTIQKREKLQQLYNGSAESLVKFIGGYYYRDEKKRYWIWHLISWWNGPPVVCRQWMPKMHTPFLSCVVNW